MKETASVTLLTPMFMELWPIAEGSMWAGVALAEAVMAVEDAAAGNPIGSLADLVDALSGII